MRNSCGRHPAGDALTTWAKRVRRWRPGRPLASGKRSAVQAHRQGPCKPGEGLDDGVLAATMDEEDVPAPSGPHAAVHPRTARRPLRPARAGFPARARARRTASHGAHRASSRPPASRVGPTDSCRRRARPSGSTIGRGARRRASPAEAVAADRRTSGPPRHTPPRWRRSVLLPGLLVQLHRRAHRNDVLVSGYRLGRERSKPWFPAWGAR